MRRRDAVVAAIASGQVAVRMFGGDGVEDGEAVALIEEDAMRVVAVDAVRNCSGALRAPNFIVKFSAVVERRYSVFQNDLIERLSLPTRSDGSEYRIFGS